MAGIISKKMITNGLVLYLDVSNTKSFISGSTVCNDLSATIANGILINGPTYNSSNGGSIVFDGVDDYIDCGTSSLLNFGTGNYTVNIWFKTNTSIRRTLFSRFDYDGTGTIERGYYMDVLANGKVRSGFEVNGNNYRITDSLTTVNTNQYFCATVVRTNENTVNLYINGIFESTNGFTQGSTSSINAVTAPFSIGRRADYQTLTFTNYFVGNIPQIAVYNRALSAAEILQNYNSSKKKFGL